MTTRNCRSTKDPCVLTRFQSVVTVSDKKHAKLNKYEKKKVKLQECLFVLTPNGGGSEESDYIWKGFKQLA